MNRERKVCRSKYYEAKVEHLKDCKPAKWWKEIKKLSGMSSASGRQNDVMNSLRFIEEVSSTSDLANIVNDAFILPMKIFSPLPHDFQLEQDIPSSAPFVLSVHSVFMKLSLLNPTKAQGPDGLPAWLLKENADLLAEPIAEIINSSFRESRLPPSWKEADIVPVPKQRIVKDVSKHLRPISLTPILSKVAEEFIIQEYVKPAVLIKIKSTQFGSIPKSSTTQALISMIHTWSKYTDGTGSTVRVVVFDFRKAFDLIDHNILVRKLKDLNIPHNIVSWIVDFLKCRKQRVKLSQDCKSEWKNVPAGVPQGTKLGPWLFVLMIDDIDTTNTDLWKYVDDTTAAEMVEKGETSKIQNIVNELTEKTYRNKFQFNEKKCKELRISFTKNHPEYAPIVINDKPIEIVTTIKLLGLNISNNLKWHHHIEEIVKKASTRLYFPRQLKRAKVAEKELLTFYKTCIRPITEYACPVFHNGLPTYLSDELERIQKRAMQIIFPNINYQDALKNSNLLSSYERREYLTNKLFEEICSDPNHKLHYLVPKRNETDIGLRNRRMFNFPVCKTNRLKNSFIFSNSSRKTF